jgi:hypothetical protein
MAAGGGVGGGGGNPFMMFGKSFLSILSPYFKTIAFLIIHCGS